MDVEDAAYAHILALQAPATLSGIFNISAQSPFHERDTAALLRDARAVIRGDHPQAEELFRARGWALPERIDRVYAIEKAKQALGYAPRRNFDSLLQQLATGERGAGM